MIASGEFSRLMRVGWRDGFVAELTRLRKKGLRPPVWAPGSCKLLPEPPWAAIDRKAQLANNKHADAQRVAQERAVQLKEQARSLDEQKHAWASKVSQWSMSHPEAPAYPDLSRPATTAGLLPRRAKASSHKGMQMATSLPSLNLRQVQDYKD